MSLDPLDSKGEGPDDVREDLLVICVSGTAADDWCPFADVGVAEDAVSAEYAGVPPATLSAIRDELEKRRCERISGSMIEGWPTGLIPLDWEWIEFARNAEQSLDYLSERMIPACIAQEVVIRIKGLHGPALSGDFWSINQACTSGFPFHRVIVPTAVSSELDWNPCMELKERLCSLAFDRGGLLSELDRSLDIYHIYRKRRLRKGTAAECKLAGKFGDLTM
jgi:hypothetical protein